MTTLTPAEQETLLLVLPTVTLAELLTCEDTPGDLARVGGGWRDPAGTRGTWHADRAGIAWTDARHPYPLAVGDCPHVTWRAVAGHRAGIHPETAERLREALDAHLATPTLVSLDRLTTALEGCFPDLYGPEQIALEGV